jgi:hypothetical protein
MSSLQLTVDTPLQASTEFQTLMATVRTSLYIWSGCVHGSGYADFTFRDIPLPCSFEKIHTCLVSM